MGNLGNIFDGEKLDLGRRGNCHHLPLRLDQMKMALVVGHFRLDLRMQLNAMSKHFSDNNSLRMMGGGGNPAVNFIAAFDSLIWGGGNAGKEQFGGNFVFHGGGTNDEVGAFTNEH